FITCDTKSDAIARITVTGVEGGLTSLGSGSTPSFTENSTALVSGTNGINGDGGDEGDDDGGDCSDEDGEDDSDGNAGNFTLPAGSDS
ncbi:hypothetical protein Clacol_005045, partial [Clathrus columnatus]